MATPTSLPATFVAGNVLTAAQMNNLRGAFRILQVVSTTKTDAFSTTSTSYTDITGLSVSITPSSATSKVLVISNTSLSCSAANLIELVLDRDGTDICVSASGKTQMYAPRSQFGIDEMTGLFLDSPATTSAVTYQLQIKVSNDIGYVNRRGNAATPFTTSTITAFEVSA